MGVTGETTLVKRKIIRGMLLVVVAAVSATTACTTGSESKAKATPAPTSAPNSETTAKSPAPACNEPDACTTRQLAEAAGVIFGTAVTSKRLNEPEYSATLLDTFNSVTPEYELKWDAVQPLPDKWNFGPADQIVDFAKAHDLQVKGHALIWDQDLVDSTPEWVLAIDDPVELRSVVTTHITKVMGRYRDSVDRWDVVNEPLQTLGSGMYDNHFRQVLGDDYIAEMFRIAHTAEPDAQLWLNEAAVEYQPEKAAALVALVAGLVNAGVPIDGVGIQGHLIGGTVDGAILAQLVADLEALGVQVAITELDIPASDPVSPLEVQADTYREALGACLINQCREVTLWGFTDRYTWIDATFGDGLAPLPFDRNYQPKPALAAIRDRLSAVLAAR